jgi:hypothetical protein
MANPLLGAIVSPKRVPVERAGSTPSRAQDQFGLPCTAKVLEPQRRRHGDPRPWGERGREAARRSLSGHTCHKNSAPRKVIGPHHNLVYSAQAAEIAGLRRDTPLSSAGERSLHTGEVVGSIPTAPTNKNPNNKHFSAPLQKRHTAVCGRTPHEHGPPRRAKSVQYVRFMFSFGQCPELRIVAARSAGDSLGTRVQ